MIAWNTRPVVSIVIPAYNEEKNITGLLERTCRAVESSSLPYEIIVVDDGSNDKTRELALQHKTLVLWNKENRGKGSALRKGIAHAQGEIIVTMDADGSHDPEEIPKLMQPMLEGATIALGTRFSADGGKKSTKTLNLLGNGIINLSIFMMTGKRVTDSQCGFRAIKRDFLKKIKIVSDGFEVETELLLKALKNGNIVREVSLNVSKRKNGHSHINPLSDGLKIMRTVLKANLLD